MGRYHPPKPAKPVRPAGPARSGPAREYTGRGHRDRAARAAQEARETALLRVPGRRNALLAAEADGARAALAALPDAPAVPVKRSLPRRGVNHKR